MAVVVSTVSDTEFIANEVKDFLVMQGWLYAAIACV